MKKAGTLLFIKTAFVGLVIFIALFFLLPAVLFGQDLPEWATEYGLKSPYSSYRYVTGFGIAERTEDDAEMLAAVKNSALDDLIRKIRVQVSSSITIETAEGRGKASSSVSMVSQTISAMKLTNVEFEIAKDWKHYYALAFASKNSLRSMYIGKGKDAIQYILREKARAENDETVGSVADIIDRYIKILPYFSEVMESRSIYSILTEDSSGDEFFQETGIQEVRSADDLFRIEGEVRTRIDTLQKGAVVNLDAALDKIFLMLSTQGVKGASFQVPPFLYQNSDFTSSFGRYAAGKMESLTALKLVGGRGKVAIRGTYWEKEDSIELIVIAKSVDTGENLGSGFAQFPLRSIPRQYDIKPMNAAEALQTQYAIADGAIVDGGLHVEVWTNRGRNDDVLVFSEGESLELYFKVNQPAFLQVTYDLATGEKVLLEESYYIGMDMVNRVVKYPYEFEVVPPFGVEHLMVTAFSKQQPPANVVIDYIDGERYEVFADAKAVVAQTRGLKKKQDDSGNTEVKVGEAFLTMTTLPAD